MKITITTTIINLTQKKNLALPFSALLLVVFMALGSASSLVAQEASLKIQKNIVERIDRLDEYIRDTIDPNMMRNNNAAWSRLKNLKDSLEVLQLGIRSWSAYQDSVSSLLLNQQDLIGSQQRMIDAINWQIKDVLSESADLRQALGIQTAKADQLVLENLNLLNNLRILRESNDSLTAKWSINEMLLNEILAISKDNQRVIKTLPPDTALIRSIQADSTTSRNEF